MDFRRNVMPIINEKCVRCHDARGAPPRLDGGLEPVAHAGGGAYFNRAYESLLAPGASGDEEGSGGQYVHPGTARTSPLIWRIFGRNTSRPWDAATAPKRADPVSGCEANRLTEDERRTFAEWIDMGALWDGIPGTDDLPGGSHHMQKGDR
ncbi:MAG: hypothetical protein A2V70_16430 [Planctomycetes bacterium RBG_13_63_9]|nr:MAG: hypothetical protein A2V70_16430 [Planctomycetes bacterium RBG_13_63_9]